MSSTLPPGTPLSRGPSPSQLAGGSYVLIICLGIACMGAVSRYRSADGDALATVASVRAGELGLRVSLVGELTMLALVLVAAVSLHALVRQVHPVAALLGLIFRGAEAVIGAALVALSTAYPLWLVRHGSGSPADVARLVHELSGLARPGLDVVLFFMGVGGVLFLALFWRSRLVPRLLAGWGVVTYATMVAVPVVSLLVPGVSEDARMMLFAPGGLFELSFGLWLLVKGVHR